MFKNLFFKILFVFVFSFIFSNFFSLILAQTSLDPPLLLYPTDDEEIWAGTVKFDWNDTDANFYKYHINLPSGESEEGVVSSSYKDIYDLKIGNYNWAVKSCEDADGLICGQWSNNENFTIIEPPSQASGGLVPCGRRYDDPNTPEINESEPCGFKHIFLLLKNLLDFVLWRLGLIILVLLALLTGVIFYFSFGGPTVMAKVKSLLKSAITGYILILLAWMIINFLLIIFGFQVEIFGRWWQITL